MREVCFKSGAYVTIIKKGVGGNVMKLSQKNGFLDANQLKWIAILAMLFDHFAAIILTPLLTEVTLGLVAKAGLYGSIVLLRLVGRLAFPIFSFLIVNGYLHTSNKARYLMRLSGFAIISEPFFDFALKGGFFDVHYQNVFFTLALGLAAIWGYDTFKQKEGPFTPKGCLIILLCMTAAFYMKSDYDFYGVLFIVMMYLTSHKPQWFVIGFVSLNVLLFGGQLMNVTAAVQMALVLGYQDDLLGTVMTILIYVYHNLQLAAILACPIIMCYNGQKGRAQNKYLFYLFYPLHLALLGLLSLFIQ